MISIFKEGSGHLLTYPGEGDPSFSANCNGLMAILRAPNIEKYLPHVENITNFLCNSYLAGAVKDKWVRNNGTIFASRLTSYRIPRPNIR